MREFDIKHGDDASDEEQWSEIRQTMEDGFWHAVMFSPPCETFSRARNSWQSHPGPRPLRSRNWPNGFPWLSGKSWNQCQLANDLIHKTLEGTQLCLHQGTLFMLEHPEDLGVTQSGETPASIWQIPELQSFTEFEGVLTWALFQCHFGAETPKPTRLLSNCSHPILPKYLGWPLFDESNRYQGPLPAHCGRTEKHKQLIGR